MGGNPVYLPSSLPWLYLTSIIKINRPISYVKYHPRAWLNILSVSTPNAPSTGSFFSTPFLRGGKEPGKKEEIGGGSGTRFRFASSRATNTLGMPSFNGEHSCGQYGIPLRLLPLKIHSDIYTYDVGVIFAMKGGTQCKKSCRILLLLFNSSSRVIAINVKEYNSTCKATG